MLQHVPPIQYILLEEKYFQLLNLQTNIIAWIEGGEVTEKVITT